MRSTIRTRHSEVLQWPSFAHRRSPHGTRVLPSGDVVVPLEARDRSRVRGSVTLHPSGKATTIEVTMFNDRALIKPNVLLYAGTDCVASQPAAIRYRLNPVNSGQTSRTVVELPIEKIETHYVIDVRDATQRAAAADACARIGP